MNKLLQSYFFFCTEKFANLALSVNQIFKDI